MNTVSRIAMIANGDTPRRAEVLVALSHCDGCVCCDRLPPEGAPPLLQVVGDMDSLCTMLDPAFVTDEHEDQETNDLTKALRWATAHYPNAQIDFFAVTGKREDHTLANLALITEAQRTSRVFTESGRFDVVLAGETRLEVELQTPISFLSFIPQQITVKGVAWPVEQLNLSSLWRATLNRTIASQVVVQCEQPLLIYRPWSNV